MIRLINTIPIYKKFKINLHSIDNQNKMKFQKLIRNFKKFL